MKQLESLYDPEVAAWKSDWGWLDQLPVLSAQKPILRWEEPNPAVGSWKAEHALAFDIASFRCWPSTVRARLVNTLSLVNTLNLGSNRLSLVDMPSLANNRCLGHIYWNLANKPRNLVDTGLTWA